MAIGINLNDDFEYGEEEDRPMTEFEILKKIQKWDNEQLSSLIQQIEILKILNTYK